jgi:hypothetical protein
LMYHTMCSVGRSVGVSSRGDAWLLQRACRLTMAETRCTNKPKELSLSQLCVMMILRVFERHSYSSNHVCCTCPNNKPPSLYLCVDVENRKTFFKGAAKCPAGL